MTQEDNLNEPEIAELLIQEFNKTHVEPLIKNSILNQICTSKREHVERQKEIIPVDKLQELIDIIPNTKEFTKSINSKVTYGQNAIIAEIKKASPSKGIIREDFDPAQIAKSYTSGGATCISVLTDTQYFQGRDEYLNIVQRASNLPLLRKDFMIDEYQIIESRSLGADCILLIMAALNDDEAQHLEDVAIHYGLDVLAEIHTETELERALQLKTNLLGINNRNLKTLEINLETIEKLAPHIPPSKITVCESGIYTHADIEKINKIGVYSFLVGESLMSQDNIQLALEQLLGKQS